MDCSKHFNKKQKFSDPSYKKTEDIEEILNEGCSTTEDFSDLEIDDEKAVSQFNTMVKQLVEEALADKVTMLVDLGIETYELRKKNEASRKEYKLVKKNVNKK